MDNNQNNGYFDRSEPEANGNASTNGLPPLNKNVTRPTTGMAIGALVCGILSIVLSCCCGVGIVPAVIGLILALVDRKQGAGFSGISLAGLICSIIGAAISLLMIVYFVLVYASLFNDPDLMSMYESMLNEGEIVY